MLEKCIIAISHSNYLIKNAGTEKCMREIQKALLNSQIHYFQIFSFEKYSNLYKLSDMSDKIGVNYDNKFLGVFSYSSLPWMINYIQKNNNVRMVGVHINNVINHDLILLKHFLSIINLPLVVWIHDYSAICEKSPILLVESGESCNNFSKDIHICNKHIKCKGYSKEKDNVYKFYKNIDYMIEAVIVPSNSVIRNISERFFFWKNKIFLRPHLIISEHQKRKILSNPIRIAFIGGKYLHKGAKEWQIIINTFNNCQHYQFYYLGSCIEKMNSNVKNVFVDVSLQGEQAMLNTVRENNIDVAFLWSKCQETYSYTYYEALCGGAKIITYINSGNIVDSVIRDNAGLVFNSIDDLVDMMKDSYKFKNKLENLSNLYPMGYENNISLDHIIPNGNCAISDALIKKKHFELLTIVYIISSIMKKIKRGSRIEKRKCKNNR